jgi:hypothetical protein
MRGRESPQLPSRDPKRSWNPEAIWDEEAHSNQVKGRNSFTGNFCKVSMN